MQQSSDKSTLGNSQAVSSVKMAVEVGALKMKNPMLTASGTFGFGEEFADFIDLEKLGGFIVKGTTLEPREGNPYPRMAETPSGMLNAVGLQNKGVDHFISDIYPRLKGLDTNVLVNVSGAKIEDYVAVAEKLAPLDKIPAIEVNISCPNVKQGGMAFGTTTAGAESVTAAIRKAWPRTLIVKLSPNVTSIADIALAAEAGGADSVSLINTLMGMAIDVERRKPCLSTVTGGLSGAAVRPVAVRMVWQVAKAVKIPVIGLGGISSGRDAIEFMLAGARAVQIGTANFIDPQISLKAVDWMADWCVRHGVSDINEIVGEI
jgi:dihydroorotate dehydrogenase (NAD+) catalytic subunit